jgi:hypothetical protein
MRSKFDNARGIDSRRVLTPISKNYGHVISNYEYKQMRCDLYEIFVTLPISAWLSTDSIRVISGIVVSFAGA